MLRRLVATARDALAWARFGRHHPARGELSVEEVFRLEETVAALDLSRLSQEVLMTLQTMHSLSERLADATGHAQGVPVSEFARLHGFCLLKQPSTIHGAGFGCFIRGRARRGQVVCFYPGTVYHPGDPILLQSIRNHFILQRIDGIRVDGKPYGLSRRIYLSAAAREHGMQGADACDTSWLTEDCVGRPLDVSARLRNPLALGHYANHHPTGVLPNVMYLEFDFAHSLALPLRALVPNVPFRPPPDEATPAYYRSPIHSEVMIALRDLCDEELFSSYITAEVRRARKPPAVGSGD